MLTIEIKYKEKTEYYRLYSDAKRQMDLKRELLSRYPDSTELTITDRGSVLEILRLGDLFN